MKFVEKIGRIEIYEHNESEIAQFGCYRYVAIRSGNLDIIEFYKTLIEYNSESLEEVRKSALERERQINF